MAREQAVSGGVCGLHAFCVLLVVRCLEGCTQLKETSYAMTVYLKHVYIYMCIYICVYIYLCVYIYVYIYQYILLKDFLALSL